MILLSTSNFNPTIVRLKHAKYGVLQNTSTAFQSYNSSIKTLNALDIFIKEKFHFNPTIVRLKHNYKARPWGGSFDISILQ